MEKIQRPAIKELPLISIVVIMKHLSDFFIEKTIPAIRQQTYKNWELLVLPDKETQLKALKTKVIPTWPEISPPGKKDIGVKYAGGEIIAFIDDDAYPDKNWLVNSIDYFNNNRIAAVCGPGITPPKDPLSNQVSGWFWASYLGSGAAGTYRCYPGKVREVVDYPTFNLIVRKKDIEAINGFDSKFWPGEDTKFCHDLIYKLNKKIIYDPKILVYHQRRPILKAHLKQLGRYGVHRGYFVKVLPKTSRRLGYFWPAIFTLGVFGGLLLMVISLFYQNIYLSFLILIYFLSLSVYLLIDILNSFWVILKGGKLPEAIILIPVTFISHVFYGIMFIRGLLKKGLVSKYDREKL